MEHHKIRGLGFVVAAALLALAIVIGLVGRNTLRHQTVNWAATVGDLETLKRLEAKGASLNAQDTKSANWTPLIAAIYHKHANIVQYLVAQKVDLNLRDNGGRTALIWAITVEDTNSARMLLESGADATIRDKDGIDAFGYAEASPHRSVLLDWIHKQKAQ